MILNNNFILQRQKNNSGFALISWCKSKYLIGITRELPGVALINISNGQIFTGKGNTDLKWNIEVAHVEEKIF